MRLDEFKYGLEFIIDQLDKHISENMPDKGVTCSESQKVCFKNTIHDLQKLLNGTCQDHLDPITVAEYSQSDDYRNVRDAYLEDQFDKKLKGKTEDEVLRIITKSQKLKKSIKETAESMIQRDLDKAEYEALVYTAGKRIVSNIAFGESTGAEEWSYL